MRLLIEEYGKTLLYIMSGIVVVAVAYSLLVSEINRVITPPVDDTVIINGTSKAMSEPLIWVESEFLILDVDDVNFDKEKTAQATVESNYKKLVKTAESTNNRAEVATLKVRGYEYVDIHTPGVYKLKYEATNSFGNTYFKNIDLLVR